MGIYEIDWRIGPLYAVIVGIDTGLASIRKRIDEEDGFDAVTACEHTEPLLGLGFVAAQTYALGTCADLNKIRKHQGKAPLKKLDYYRCDSIKVKGTVTRLELIHATANYFKHHDEWGAWPKPGEFGFDVTSTLGSVGITQATEFPCIKATELFTGKSWEFVVVHQVVKEWREHVLNTLG